MKRGSSTHAMLGAGLLLAILTPAFAKSAPPDPNRYLNAVREFADNVLKYGRDTYGPKHTPLFVDGLNIHTHEPVKWIAPNGDRWILSNLASQQNLLRTLDGLTRITGDPKYRQAAVDTLRYAFENLRSPNGLLYWNGLASYDAMADKPCGQNTDEVKGFYPYFELMWEVNPQVMRQYIEALWAGHILDWSNLYMDRLCYNMTKPLSRPWDYEYKGGPVFFGGNGFDMIHAASDLFYAAAFLTRLSADEVPLVWGKRLAQRYIEARNPKTGISPLGFNAKLTPYTYEFPHPNFSNQAIWAYNQYYYMPTPGVIVSPITRVWLCQLLLSETLGPGGEDFRRWAHEELTAIGKMSYNKQRNVYVPISADGTSREGYLCADDGPLGPKGSKLIAFPARPYDFLAYAVAYRITKDEFMWDMARNIAIGNKYGDIGASSIEEPQLNYDSTMPDPYGLLGFLELYRATGNPAVLRMAEHIADTMLAERFHKGFFVGGAKLVFCRFDAIDSLALLHLYAVTSGQTGIQIPQAWCGTGFFTSPYRKKEQVIDGMLYTQNEAFLPLSLQEAAAMGDFAMVKSFIEEGASVDGVESTLPMTALQHAAINGHREIVEFLLAKGAEINGRSGFPGATALHYAAQNNHKEVVELLIARGADLNAKIKAYPAGDTPLHSAVRTGNKDIVELLVVKGADVNAKNDAGQTPLGLARGQNRKDIVALLGAKLAETSIHGAAGLGDLDRVRAFLEKGTDVNAKDDDGQTPLHAAVISKRKEMAELLVAKGADVNAKDNRNYMALFYAIFSNDANMVGLLVNKGADVNFTPEKDYPPLHYAVWLENPDMARVLVDHGARFDVKDRDGWTAFRYAVSAGNRDMVNLFVAKGADVSGFHIAACVGDVARVKSLVEQGTDADARDELGWTPLYWAASTGQMETAEFLVAKGADVQAKTNDEGTALHQAAAAGERRLTELLISKGGDVNTKDKGGNSPLQGAAAAGRREVVELLIAKGADVNTMNTNDWTPLHRAALAGHKEVVEVLVAKGADVNIKNKRGQTPSDLAKQRGHAEIAELLRKHGAKE